MKKVLSRMNDTRSLKELAVETEVFQDVYLAYIPTHYTPRVEQAAR